jgi:2-polyprenyl-3-methyl-5-hydroxy-6-metoxy-1,4-benzoquinol methylase
LSSQQDISQLYNALFELESKFKKEENYPIHKKLDFKNQFDDIYELILSRVSVKDKNILDAGCGVGFGSMVLLKNGAKEVTGISVSDKEIDRATQSIKKLGLQNISFKKSTFDETENSKYDIIVCVESLKHTLNFDTSIKILLEGLKPSGKLIIVDDFFDNNHNKISKAFATNWHLNFLISQKDIEINTSEFSTKIEDLTSYVRQKSKFKTAVNITLFSLFKKQSSFKKLFLGGLLLDQLYLNKQMKYQLVIISKKP